MIGRTIGKYRIVGQLGRGGMGTVYRAVDIVLDREVAVKVLNGDFANAETMRRFRTEAVTLAKLSHPGIATIHELFQSDAELFMVMELVPGETLDRLSDRTGPLAPEHAAYLIDQVLSALEHAHRAGIVHRDMKPANVMVTGTGGVKIMDFGVARARGAEHADGHLIGTPAYMPPEQVLGQEVDGRADLYSVGVVFYRLLTGTLPFSADSAIGMVHKQISDAPTPVHVHRAGVPEWCQAIVERALAKSPDDRFQTAEEFRDTLGKATAMVALPSSSVSTGQPAEGVDGSPSPAITADSPTVGRGVTIVLPTRRSASLAASAIALLVVIVVLAIVASGRHRAHSTARSELQNGTRSITTRPIESSRGPVAYDAIAPAPTRVGSGGQAPAQTPVVSRPVPGGGSAGATPKPPAVARRPPVTHADASGSAVPASPIKPMGKTSAAPMVFEARVLVNDGDRQRERQCQVVLADGRINVQTKDDDKLLGAVPYDEVLSISYSRGRDPFWNAPTGPTRVARAGGGVLGMVRAARHWVSLRSANVDAQFIVLRLANDAQASRAIGALEQRTGLRADIVVERKDDR